MKKSLGKIISELRKENNMTQEELADRLGVSPQAVSKWENDVSCPDIGLLPDIAALFKVTTDFLLSVDSKETVVVEPEQPIDLNSLFLRIIVENPNDSVKINIPMRLVKLAVEIGMSMPQVSGNKALENLDFGKILSMVESGVQGKLMDIEMPNGTVSIYVEKR